MKKSTAKIIALVTLAAIAVYAISQHVNKRNQAAPAASSNVTPDGFEVPEGDNIKKYWKDGEKYMYQLTGPLVKSKPQEIGQAEYESAFRN